MARAASSVTLIFLLACSLCAQESPCTTRIIPVGILDAHGEVPRGLSVKTFAAELDRKPLAITATRLLSGPNRVAILLDTSESMEEGMHASGKAELAYWVAADAVKRLPASVSIALLGFNKQVDRTLDFSVSREQLTSELTQRKKALSSSIRRKTALRDAIEYVLDHIPNAAPGDAIYVITDGEDNRSQIDSAQLEDRLQRASVRLDVFLLRDFLWTGDPFPGSDDTAQLARATGGTVIDFHPTIPGTRYSGTTENFTVSPERRELVSAALTLLYRQTASPYLLGIEVPAVLKRSRRWKLNVVDQRLRKSISLSYPRHIGSCPNGRPSMPN
jgi:hypothetical protein